MLKAGFSLTVTLSLFIFIGRTVSTEINKFSEKEVDSWKSLRVDAGYFSPSGIYQGGLWRHVRTTDDEVYRCLNHSMAHCTGWSINEESRNKVEYGSCHCDLEATVYCVSWHCITEHVDRSNNCVSTRDCGIQILQDSLNCVCHVPAPKNTYCQEWICVESSSSGYRENEDYKCIEEDATGEYCYRWKGNITSSYEVESTVCECVHRGYRFCIAWRCTERSLTRCASHRGGWCRMGIAVGMGGGFGALFIFIGALLALRLEGLTNRLLTLGVSTALALPWMIGVLIWGGLPALWWVASLWITWTSFLVYIFCQMEERRLARDRDSGRNDS